MSGKRYSKKEQYILLNKVNASLGDTDRARWTKVTPMRGRDMKSMSNHWNLLRKSCTYDGRRWYMPFLDESIKSDISVNTQDSREINASQKPISKPKKVSKSIKERKSFLWGAIKIERYE